MHQNPDDELPVLVVSRCLTGDACRWDGDALSTAPAAALAGLARLVPVCPELELGLGVPRGRVVVALGADGAARLVQPDTGADLTARMAEFCAAFCRRLGAVDGVVLKKKSPSCGLGDVKRYVAPDYERHLDRLGDGFFALALALHFPGVPRADEETLADPARLAAFLGQARACCARRRGGEPS